MKQKFLTLAVFLGMFCAHANANVTVNEKVLESFKKTFVNAQSVKWTETGEYFKASFILGDHRAEAYFNEEGVMEGCVRGLFYVQLPLIVMTSIDRKYPDAPIIDVREIINADGTTYRVTLETNGKKVRIKANSYGSIIETERLKD
jgi:hypothetical protein